MPTEPAPPAPTRLVFSDVDETLISRKSLIDFFTYYFARRHGGSGRRHADQTLRCLGALTAAGAPRDQGNLAYYRAWQGERADDVAELVGHWYAAEGGEPGFYLPGTRAELRAHREAGAVLVLVSGGFPALLEPIAAEVGAHHLVCTVPEVRAGRLTGAVVGEPAIGQGKAAAVRAILARYPGLGPEDCWAYGDHVSDLPMLAEVGHPVVVGAEPALAAALPSARVLYR
ncbi:HAD-IB family hydrolase [Kitasatospora sp. NBC_01560]|uniref:HAD family hydrolase n=1 Tax=Kitasatospora sp. NBC_01560 TaxID=2975965 RepID=UPI0038669180